MKEPPKKDRLVVHIIRAPFRALSWFLYTLRKTLLMIRNGIRKLRRVQIDYVILPVSGSLPERAAPRPGFIQRQLPIPLRTAELSLEELNGILQKIAAAENVKGVLFIFQGIEAGIASIQNFRRAVKRLQSAGKEAIVYTPYLDLRHYYAAAAADWIISPPGAQFDVMGLHTEVVFLKDALQQIGVQVDVVQISPYKTAMDMLQHADITPEYQAQLDWLLDDQFDMITADLAADRRMSQQQIKDLIDQAPLFAEKAQEHGLLDHLAYEDKLSFLLAENLIEQEQEGKDAPLETNMNGEKQEREQNDQEADSPPKADLRTWRQAKKQLLEKPHRQSRRFIGVVSLNGLITMGPSRGSPLDLPIPFVGSSTAGEQTLLTLLRQAEQLPGMAALIFHVDSGGGSALAAELIARQIQRIGQKKPVLVYMGNVAASGGYYVSARAAHIMSQEGTMTGSIGVISGRPSTAGLLEKIKVNRVVLNRGRHAGLYFDSVPMSAEERDIFWDSILHSYKEFKTEVAEGRNLPYETLDPICEGRVWTGRQALGHKLLDSHGDFQDAIYKAADLAGLPYDEEHRLKVINLHPEKDGYILPQPFEAAQEIERLLSNRWIKELSGKPLMLLPFMIDWH